MSTVTDAWASLLPGERLRRLCDPGSLELFEAVAPRVGVCAGRGRVNGRPVVAYAQDSRVAGGSVGAAEGEMIVRALRHARHERLPVVGFLESAGARLQEGAAALGAFGRIFSENVALSRCSPQISVITGTSAGGGCYSPALTDFVVMNASASMFLTGPKIVRRALGEDVSAQQLGGPQVHQRNGVCDFVTEDDEDAIALVRELLSFLPQHAFAQPPALDPEPPPHGDPAAALPVGSRSFYDVRDVISRIVDRGLFLEMGSRWARNMVVGFARLEGHAIGVVANQARHLGGVIDVAASEKGARFVRTASAYGLPLLVLVDTPGFMPGTRQEALGVIRHGAELVHAFAASRSRRATVILRKAYGGAFITMNSKDLGADAAFSWPKAEIGVMGAEGAVEIIHRRELAGANGHPDFAARAAGLARSYAADRLSPEAALDQGAIDAIIEPPRTRERLAAVLVRPGGRRVAAAAPAEREPTEVAAPEPRARRASAAGR